MPVYFLASGKKKDRILSGTKMRSLLNYQLKFNGL
ncbi:hypothetical protein EV681_3947 [Advenella incenata]|uniref:Uncharacterized protein n=1 Tax=Advenella incenata TaxID=267800 RepID=A0A4Q7V944_9BURK|nr:hypothetical protein EV681_3947 [Advenella incenata]